MRGARCARVLPWCGREDWDVKGWDIVSATTKVRVEVIDAMYLFISKYLVHYVMYVRARF